MCRQGGQALVFLLGIMGALVAAMLVAHHAGQLANHKQRLLNTADAAAYSAATWEARTLNLEAYINRAVIANEVTIAQAVSLRSWSAYMRRLLDHIDGVSRFVPYLGQATRVLERLWVAVDDALQPMLTGAESAASFSERTLTGVQSLVHASGFSAARDLAEQTVRANDPQAHLSVASEALLGVGAASWLRLTTSYRGADRQRQKAVVESSLDGFTVERGFDTSPPVVGLVARIRKRGGTDLIGFDTWRGIDTLALHTRRGLFGSMRERVPVGWGGAENGRATPLGGRNGDSWRINPRTSAIALRDLRAARSYAGLPALRDIVEPAQHNERTVEVVIDLVSGPVAELPHAALRSARVAVPGAAPGQISSVLPREPLHAISAAQVYFARPEPRADGRRELPSLFNPYWQVRLAPVPARERALAALLNGTGDPFAAVP